MSRLRAFRPSRRNPFSKAFATSIATGWRFNAEMVARVVSFVGMGLAGLGGMLIGLDTTIDPLTGFRAILSVFAAAVVGGLGSIPGAVVGALTVGIGEELSLLFLSPNYRSAVGFFTILLVLIFRPRGILGQRAL
jgi:branched-chain amino acid transport system permease protein/neutral amino acid transport system permease protein